MAKIAIVGTGIAGLGCAWFLREVHDITVFEQDNRVGGHSHTVDVTEPGSDRQVPVDTGFMVYNEVTYPLLTRLFNALSIPTRETKMSFSVKDHRHHIEWCGSSRRHLFAQRRNLLRPRFIRMLLAVNRFNQEAVAALDDPATARQTLAEFVAARGYGQNFIDLYLVPMSSAVWSTPPAQMLQFPASTLIRFFHNHGFLGLNTQHQWRTVEGGSRTYVKAMSYPFASRIRTGEGATKITRTAEGVVIETSQGKREVFDQVIIATHGDQALTLLGDPTPEEQRLLGAFRYQANVATVHSDQKVMPKRKRAWSSWNYEIRRHADDGSAEPATHYWMNSLQEVSKVENYFVSINGSEHIDPAKVIRQINYTHPLFTLEAVKAQGELPALNACGLATTKTFFAGSYFGNGFHEDGFRSAFNLASLLLGSDPWRAIAANRRT